MRVGRACGYCRRRVSILRSSDEMTYWPRCCGFAHASRLTPSPDTESVTVLKMRVVDCEGGQYLLVP
jgi:hypothetical protein